MTPAQQCLAHPRAFAWRVLSGFRANQGLLLAGAVAYYALLSIVPLLILSVIWLSHLIPEHELLETLGRYLAWVVPLLFAANPRVGLQFSAYGGVFALLVYYLLWTGTRPWFSEFGPFFPSPSPVDWPRGWRSPWP